jgi:hypothetical protein
MRILISITVVLLFGSPATAETVPLEADAAG